MKFKLHCIIPLLYTNQIKDNLLLYQDICLSPNSFHRDTVNMIIHAISLQYTNKYRGISRIFEREVSGFDIFLCRIISFNSLWYISMIGWILTAEDQ